MNNSNICNSIQFNSYLFSCEFKGPEASYRIRTSTRSETATKHLQTKYKLGSSYSNSSSSSSNSNSSSSSSSNYSLRTRADFVIGDWAVKFARK
jgi:hypothetical protein